jgi:hypothetical protein
VVRAKDIGVLVVHEVVLPPTNGANLVGGAGRAGKSQVAATSACIGHSWTLPDPALVVERHDIAFDVAELPGLAGEPPLGLGK